MENPLRSAWNTPFGTPPFDLIKIEHFIPAIEEAISSAMEEIKTIIADAEPPSFENTIIRLDRSGTRLADISAVLYNLNSAETNKELQSVAQAASPILARFSNDITMNEDLFRKVKSVYDSVERSQLSHEDQMLLEKHYRNFIHGGAGLDPEKKKRFREISEELSNLSVRFEENILNDTNSFELHLTNRTDLAGIPEGTLEMAAQDAADRNKEGCIFTLHYPSYIPFMKYSENRALREKMYRAYASRAFHNDSHDNRELCARISDLRREEANLLGFSNYAELALADRMADTTGKVVSFLENLHHASLKAAQRDIEEVRSFAAKSGHSGSLERWDWAYYSEKLQKEKFGFDDELLRPYFSLDNTEKAVFSLATTLYGITFRPLSYIQVYHKDVKTWEVSDADGKFLAILYADYFPRPGKLGGAWMTSYRDQHILSDSNIRPLISIVANFTRPTPSRPSLLTYDELTTFLHEFGHSLHGMLSDCKYQGLSGTNVARDFVELPSQIMENFALEKEWLRTWAVHYKTGETIPEDLIDRMKSSSTFNEGYACNRQLGFGFLDMAWHTITETVTGDVTTFEKAAMERTELFPAVKETNLSVSFGHVFSGGYAAGYYGYKWAEVLDADAFSLFREKGIFDHNTAMSFRKNILEKGGSRKPMDLYINFRGREPSIEAFLERSGLK